MSLLVPERARRSQYEWEVHYLVTDRAKQIAAWLGFLVGTPIAIALVALLHLNFDRTHHALLAFTVWAVTCVGMSSWLAPRVAAAAFYRLGSFPAPPTPSEVERRKARRADSAKWTVTFVIWGFGAYLLIEIWYWVVKKEGTIADLLDISIHLIAYFYFLALWPIRQWINRMLGED